MKAFGVIGGGGGVVMKSSGTTVLYVSVQKEFGKRKSDGLRNYLFE